MISSESAMKWLLSELGGKREIGDQVKVLGIVL